MSHPKFLFLAGLLLTSFTPAQAARSLHKYDGPMDATIMYCPADDRVMALEIGYFGTTARGEGRDMSFWIKIGGKEFKPVARINDRNYYDARPHVTFVNRVDPECEDYFQRFLNLSRNPNTGKYLYYVDPDLAAWSGSKDFKSFDVSAAFVGKLKSGAAAWDSRYGNNYHIRFEAGSIHR